MNRFRPTTAEVNLSALARNAELIFRTLNKPDFFCPMVKANAYGHGDLVVSKKLRSIGVKHLGVGLIEEGVHLRESGDKESILHFGMFDRHGLREMLAQNLTPVISSLEAIELINEEVYRSNDIQSKRAPLEVHLKINTGMNRLGIDPSVVTKAATRIGNSSGIKLTGVATHFASGDLLSDPGSAAADQLRLFDQCISDIVKCGLSGFVKHIANSDAAAELASLGLSGYGARPGLSLYGVPNPSVHSSKPFPVEPVLTLRSAIVHLQDVRQGARVSYGGTWIANRDTRIGVIPCGYADGYRRGLAGSEILVHGQRVPIVGTICMDYFMCDLTSVPLAKVGDEVILLGKSGSQLGSHNVTVSELAHRLGTIPYEILTGLSERVPRLYNDDGSHISLV
ncbi:MAG: alanine racemase [Bdellovibrionales bacterium]|nr:alanine racemase [Bdellovibrionales bacterium]